MLQWKQDRAAFTLIELLVVVIIVAVLAAVGVPLLSANVERSQMTEAETGLGTIRTGLRAYSVENTAFPTDVPTLGFLPDDFRGQFFDLNDYTFLASPKTFGPPHDYCIVATGGKDPDDAPGNAKVTGKFRSMDENGTIYKTNNCT